VAGSVVFVWVSAAVSVIVVVGALILTATGAAACRPLLDLQLLPAADGQLVPLLEAPRGATSVSHSTADWPIIFVVTEALELLLVGSQSEKCTALVTCLIHA